MKCLVAAMKCVRLSGPCNLKYDVPPSASVSSIPDVAHVNKQENSDIRTPSSRTGKTPNTIPRNSRQEHILYFPQPHSVFMTEPLSPFPTVEQVSLGIEVHYHRGTHISGVCAEYLQEIAHLEGTE